MLPQQLGENGGDDQSHLPPVANITGIVGKAVFLAFRTHQHHHKLLALEVQIKHIELALQRLGLHQMPPKQLFYHQLLGLIGTMPVFTLQILIAVFHHSRCPQIHPWRRLMSRTNRQRSRGSGRRRRRLFSGRRKQRFKTYNILCHSGPSRLQERTFHFPQPTKCIVFIIAQKCKK